MTGEPHVFSLGDLRLGVATAAVQIEGGDRNNSWYDWARQRGRIADGSSPERATDHWHRWREDTDLMVGLGIRDYRMGIEWARIEPRPGEFDDAAIARYREELAYLRERGVTPLVTLHHFSNPMWFEASGAFERPDSVDTFLRYVHVVVEEIGDLVTDWVTINEPNVYAVTGYLFGEGPPGVRSYRRLRTVLRHLAMAHCRAYRLIHDLQPGTETRVGFAHHLRVFDALNPRNPIHRVLARTNGYLFQDALSDAMLGGRFPMALGGQPDGIRPGAHYDYLGINYYSRTAVSKMADGTFPDRPVNDLGWEIYPEGIVAVAEALHRRYPGPIWITENGTCDATDAFRARYLNDHLAAIAGSSLPFERYYHWCFVDNWEWALGEVPRFGLVHLDYETQERTVKDSGRFYAEVIAERGVTAAAYERYVATQSYQRQAQPTPHG